MQPAKFLVFLVSLLFTCSAQSQSLYKQKQQGPYLLLYQLTPEQVSFLAQNPAKVDSQFLFTRLVGKISTDSIIPLRRVPNDNYPVKPFSDNARHLKCSPRFHVWDLRINGYFLEVDVSNLFSVNYRLIENPLFNSGIHKIGFETFVFVEDTAGIPVYDARVYLDTALCPFDSTTGGYRIRGKNLTGILKIERAGQFTITRLLGGTDKTNDARPPKDRYTYSKMKYQGYLVTNQPRYKPWDTLFYKSFIVNRKGKPIKEKLTLQCSQDGYPYRKNIRIKPKYRGAYDGFVVLNDSFQLDKTINLNIYDRRNRLVKSQTVWFEAYELKDIRFSLVSDKSLVTPGAGIRFYASAQTTNRLPVMDGKLSFRLQLQDVSFTDGDSVVIPFQKYQNWFSANVQTDPSGVTIFEIPDSVFIPLEGTYTATCSLTTSDNELRTATSSFSYQTTRDRLESGMDGDTLYVKRFYNMQPVQRKMRIKIYSRKDQIADSLIQTPLRLYLPPHVYYAQIFKGDTAVGTFYRQTRVPEITGKRTHDSIHIRFRSEFDIPVFYRIYANNRLVKGGCTTSLDWHIKDPSKNSYHLQYGILDGSVINPRFFSKSFHLAEKELKVDIIQPDIIYPGQEVAIEIRVKNAYGKPVNKVNLAAWAVNTQLDNIPVPEIPYLGLVKQQKPLPLKSLPHINLPGAYQGYLSAWQIEAFMLRNNAFFKLAYPNGGFEILHDTTPLHTTEIVFFAHGAYSRNEITYVKANDTLVYSSVTTPKPGVLRIRPGKYDFDIRTFGHYFHFKNIEIHAGMKNFFCLQLDSLIRKFPADTLSPGLLTPAEQKMFLEHTFLYRFDYANMDTLIIKANGKTQYGFHNAYHMDAAAKKVVQSTELYIPGATMRNQVSRQTFYALGTFQNGSNLEIYWKKGYAHVFKFQPGYLYGFTRTDLVKEENKRWTEEIKFTTNANGNPYELNAFWWDPLYKDTAKIRTAQSTAVPKPYTPQIQLSEYQYRNYFPALSQQVYNSSLNFYLPINYLPRRIWLFDRKDSSYSILENHNQFQMQYPSIGMRARRNLWTVHNKKQMQEFRLVIELNDSTWLVKDLRVDSSSHVFLTFQSNSFRKLGEKEFMRYNRLVKILGKEPLNLWLDTPTINKGFQVIEMYQKDGRTYIEGTVIGPGVKYPVADANVVLEKNGFFVCGAITNKEGRFQMNNLQPGNYMLKIRGKNYYYWVHYQVEIKFGYLHLLQLQLTPYKNVAYRNMVYGDEYVITERMNKNSYTSSAAPEANYSMDGVYLSEVAIASRNVMKVTQRAMGAIGNEVRSKTKGNSGPYKQDGAPGEEAWTRADQDAEEQRLLDMAGDKNAQKTRVLFRDYAYWKPNLYTNREGKAGFSVRFPDNITSWQTFVPAMDAKRHSGLGQLTVKSYKPVSVNLALPSFLTEGDTLIAYSRLMNYTGKTLSGNFFFNWNQSENRKELTTSEYHSDSIRIQSSQPGDTLTIAAGFELPNGYRDAEQRQIPVIAASVTGGKSVFMEIRSDTAINFICPGSDLGMDVAIYNHKLGILLEILEQIEQTEVYDIRSKATYLQALLIKKSISKTLEIPFSQEKEIKETMNFLKKAQGDQGLFPWFRGGKPTFVVSTYVAEIMFLAHQNGYENNTWLNAARAMEQKISGVSGMEKLEYLLCLKKMNRTLDYATHIKTLDPVLLNQTEKLAYYRLLQMLGQNFPLSALNEMLEPTTEGNLKVPGTWFWRYAPVSDDAANSFTAWQIMFDAGYSPERRKALVAFLASECPSPANSRIKAAHAMLAEALKEDRQLYNLKSEVRINDIPVSTGTKPALFHVKPGKQLKFEHKGAPVYLAMNRKYLTYAPETDPEQFEVHLSTPGLSGRNLKPGIATEINIKVFAKKHQYNAVIEVPIPAACVYENKIQNESPWEMHRVYKKDRVLIFCEELPFGYHTFTVRLMPRFKGTFYTAPVRSALSFYPDKAAYTPKQRWKSGN